VIAVATMLYAAVWPLALVLPRDGEGEPQAAIRLLVITTFAYLMISVLAGLELLESRQDKPSGARPPRRPLPCGRTSPPGPYGPGGPVQITGPPGPRPHRPEPVGGPRAPPLRPHRPSWRAPRSAAATALQAPDKQANSVTKTTARAGGLSGRSLPGPGRGMQELACPAPGLGEYPRRARRRCGRQDVIAAVIRVAMSL
jgi:hypothetical protein